MALSKKTTPAPSEPFRVPSLAEVDDTYGLLVAKRADLNAKLGEAIQARRQAEKDLAADETHEVRPAVAELLGDGPSAKSTKRRALVDAKQAIADIEAALSEVERRIRDAKTAATRSMIARVRSEWVRRTSALCDALKAVQEAHLHFEELRLDLEVEDVTSDHFGPRPFFLGDARDGHIARFLKEAGHGN